MAPNKKKKKPASNPARGFATTSIASKPKVYDNLVDDTLVKEAVPETGIENGDTVCETAVQNRQRVTSRELYELTPGELELQLEESDLQLLLEKHGVKSKKDASRQYSRLETERRVLRLQAENLSTRAWLPAELVQLVLNLLALQIEHENLNGDLDGRQSIAITSEDDLVIKLWTLKQVLLQIGFSPERTQSALCQLLKRKQSMKSLSLYVGRDSIWGFEDCMDWLALVCKPGEMSSYDPIRTGRQSKRLVPYPTTELLAEEDTPSNTPPRSRPVSPLADAEPSIHSSTSDSASESDGDAEPSQIVERYILLQSRLFRLQPDLTRWEPRRVKTAGTGSKSTGTKWNPEVARLRRKIDKIESDILFDQDDAYEKWVLLRNNLAKDAAERKRFRLDDNTDTSKLLISDNTPGEASPEDSSPISDESGGVNLLGDFFSGLPDTTTDTSTGATSMTNMTSDGTIVINRDFGSWNGTNPRRIFEEACIARDSMSRVLYSLISSSSMSKRHSLIITWSRSQELPSILPLTSILCRADHRSVKIEMSSIATPTTAQSEAYISTVALFLIFASVPKEEKAYLRLPPIWRDVWAELAAMRKDQIDAFDRDVLRELRLLVSQEEYVDGSSATIPLTDAQAQKKRVVYPEGPTNIVEVPTITADDLKSIWSSRKSTPSYNFMLDARKKLPVWKFKDELLSAIDIHQVIIICGETGCGKSTQIPAYILEHELSNGRSCKVYCTEPRRISAVSLARRVSEELGEKKHDVGTSRSLVGYAIRLESHMTTQTRLVYATTGIVMRMLERSNDLGNITHLVLDEIHERSIDSDFLLIVLRKLMTRRPNLKVLLMSATVDAQHFSNYLNAAPIMNVPGRTFPVETRYLEDAVEATEFSDQDISVCGPQVEDDDDNEENVANIAAKRSSVGDLQGYSAKTRSTIAKMDEYRIAYDLIVKLLSTIATSDTYASYSKAVLVFLPGIAEIRRLNDMLLNHRSFAKGWYIYPLHSTIAMEEQEQAFLVPPKGIRKIVLATNIAETGITIPDVTCVIDTGKHKEMRFDERRQLSRLIESFISRANAKQRRGRAGRVQDGLCFHMFTKVRHDKMMAGEQTPEMLRLSLQDLVLRVKICKLGGIEQTLSDALDPPSSKNIRRAIDSLIDVKALTATEDLTALGRQLARLPLDVFLGKLVLLGSMFRCLDAALTIAAILSSKSPFSAPMGSRSQADLARLAYKKGDSDLLTVYNAYCAWRRVISTNGASEQQFCRKNFLSQQTLSSIEDLKAQLTTSLVDAGFLMLNETEKVSLNRARFYSRKRYCVEIPEIYDSNNSNDLILDSVIAWSFYPKLLKRDGKGWRNVANNQTVSLHPTSVNKGAAGPLKWLSFYHIMQSSNKFYNAHETTAVEDFPIALACGDADIRMYSGVIIIDGNRIRFRVDDWKVMLAIKALRINIRQIVTQAFHNPGRQLSERQLAWMDIWQKLFDLEGRDKR